MKPTRYTYAWTIAILLLGLIVLPVPQTAQAAGEFYAPNASSLSIDNVTITEGDSGTTNFVFTVTLSPAEPSLTVTVDFTTANGSATAGSDYIATSGTLTFAPNDTSETITVQVYGDTLNEDNEYFYVNLSNNVNATISDPQGLGTINNDDPLPSLSINDVTTAVESGTAVFTVTLSTASGKTVYVNFATSDGTATAGSDYGNVSSSLSFSAGQTTRTISISIYSDSRDEDDETFNITLSSPTNATINDGSGLGTITDDDPTPTLTINDRSTGESGTASFTVSLSAVSGKTVTVQYATSDDTATAGSDYTAASGTLTFVAGDTSETINVPILTDSLDEYDETYDVILSSPTNATLSDDTGLGTITDDDSAPNLSITSISIAENGSGTAIFTVNLSAASGKTVTVNYATQNFQAVAPGDFTATSGTLTFTPGATSQPINVTIINDTLDENNEDLIMNLSSPVNAGLSNSQAFCTIMDDDPAPSMSISDASVTETDSGTATMVFTVTLSAASGKTPVSAQWATSNGTATTSDYTSASGYVGFSSGQTTQTVSITILGDLLDENDETLYVTLTNPTNATISDATGVGTILDNDPTPTLSINDVTSASETGTIQFTVSLSAASGRTVTVQYATSNGTATAGADYTSASGTLTFTPGQATQTVNVTILTDTRDEYDETFNVTLSSPSNAAFGDDTGVGTITDDDSAPNLTIYDVTVTEGDSGTLNATFSVILSAMSEKTVTVNYQTTNGTATQPVDYTFTTGALTFVTLDTIETITVPVVGDLLDEDNETFNVLLSGAANAGISDNSGRCTITDNDPTPTLSINDFTSVNESGAASFIVSLSAASGRTVTVNYATSNGTALSGSDYNSASGTLTFTPGDTSETIYVTILGDALDENNETFNVTLSTPGNATINDGSGLGTITDDDPTPTLSINDVTTANETGSAWFTVSLSAPSGRTVTVQYTTSNGTATAGSDYTTTSGTLTFNPGDTTENISVAILTDPIDEDNETFFVTLSSPSNATLADDEGLGTITDDDNPPTVSISDGGKTEGNSGTSNILFAVTLSTSSSKTITVQYATSNGSAVEPGDYTANSGTLTFVPGDTSETITVSVNGDLISEDNETFNVTLSAPTNASLGDPTGLGTIQNDDNSVLNINDRSIVEGNSGTATLVFTVTLSLENARTVTVQYATANGSASAPGDYEAASGTLTFVPGDLQETISITVTGDTMDEPNEVFSVNLSSPVYATIGDGNGAGTITDDDDPPTLSIQDGSRSEGDSGAASMVFTVTLSEASGFSVSVDYAEGAPGTATPGVDYTAPSGGTLTFVPGETQKTFTVDVLGDTLDENDETFNLALSNASNASILDGDAVGTIMDDDTARISIADAVVVEGESGSVTLVFTVTLSTASDRTVTVDFTTTDSSASAGSDYLAAAGTVTFVPGDTQEVIEITIYGDTEFEPDENFTVDLTDPVNAEIEDAQAEGEILNDDSYWWFYLPLILK